jgi:hypothetical protein
MPVNLAVLRILAHSRKAGAAKELLDRLRLRRAKSDIAHC